MAGAGEVSTLTPSCTPEHLDVHWDADWAGVASTCGSAADYSAERCLGTSSKNFKKYHCGVLFLVFVRFFQDRISLCSPGCPRTHFVDHAGLELM